MADWSDDKLGRKGEADYLTNYLTQRYKLNPDAFVLNIKADWGFSIKLKMHTLQLMHRSPAQHFIQCF